MDPISLSKFLSFVLRHQPEAIGLVLDHEGWADVDHLVELANRSGRRFDRAAVEAVVAESDKRRFALSADGRSIRAVQGHSAADVAIVRAPMQPPATLYHGTADRFLEAILREGLRPGQRHEVHLSGDADTARMVGRRHGRPVVLRVMAEAMAVQGHEFYRAENGVWLTLAVPPAFLAIEGD